MRRAQLVHGLQGLLQLAAQVQAQIGKAFVAGVLGEAIDGSQGATAGIGHFFGAQRDGQHRMRGHPAADPGDGGRAIDAGAQQFLYGGVGVEFHE